ncbi:hypothetical protein ACFE04_030398 [Oxalis oulophora]
MRPLLIVLLISVFAIVSIAADDHFDVRQHLSTVTRYGAVKDFVNTSYVPVKIPDQCTPIHLNLVARHGTRSPTKKRIKEMEKLADRLQLLLSEAKDANKVPAWLKTWQSPWKGKRTGGELIKKGEEELYDMALRIRERFPDLLGDEYHPDVYPIKATQIPRASASAVAFGTGFFSQRGSLGPGRHRAFSVTSENRASDLVLRFFESCQNYKGVVIVISQEHLVHSSYLLVSVKKEYRKGQEPAVSKLKEPLLDEITSALVKRYELNFNRQDTASLWFLCKQEASLLDITDQSCALFKPSEVALLEWTDDLEVFLLKGYGQSINYRMGVPLLRDVIQSMDQAIQAKEEKHAPGSYEKARLRFAHAETVVPFTCLLGLFLDGTEFQKIQREEPLELPPKPNQPRNWRGSVVAPFAGNNILVLYSCPAEDSSSKYFVQVLHNEQPIPMPGCGNSDFCPFEVFKEKIVGPHMKHDYNALCNSKPGPQVKKPQTSKFSQFFSWLLGNSDIGSSNKPELALKLVAEFL